METLLLIIHVLVSIVLILSILMQPGKSGGLSGGAFGGMGGGNQMFGGGGAVPLLAKVTTYTAIVFALTCVGLWYASRSTDAGPQTAAERLMEQQGGAPAPAQNVPQPFNAQQATPAAESTAQPAPADSGR